MTAAEIAVQFLTMRHFDLRIVGYGISRLSGEAGKAFLIYIYIRCCSRKCKESLIPWSSECMTGIIKQFKLQIAAGGILLIELIANQIIIMQTSYFSHHEISAGLVYSRVGALFINVVLSFSIALSTFMANSMGEQNIERTRALSRVGLKFAAVMTISTWIVLGCYSKQIIMWFSREHLVIKSTEKLVTLYLVLAGLDFTQSVLGATVRSIGKEKVVSKSFFFTYYLVGIPVSLVLAHVMKFNLMGLFGAVGLAQLLNCIICIVILMKIDYQEQAKFIADRLQEAKICPFKEIKRQEFVDEEPESTPSRSDI